MNYGREGVSTKFGRLFKKRWEEIGETEDVKKMAVVFNRFVAQTLDEGAPMKIMIIRLDHNLRISDKTKEMMKERDEARKDIKII